MPEGDLVATQDQLRERFGELGRLQRRLEQREQALAALNRRLLECQRLQNGLDGMRRAHESADNGLVDGLLDQVRSLTERCGMLEDELARTRATKMFRWSAPLRSVYAILRSLS